MSFDIENQKVNYKPGEIGAILFMVIVGILSISVSTVYVIMEIENSDNIVWRPHRAVMGMAFLGLLSAWVFSPIGGIIEVMITNTGTVKQAIKNSYTSGCMCLNVCC